MSVIQVFGLTPLEGEISIQGSKNAVLPMMAASLLADGVTVSTFEKGAEIAVNCNRTAYAQGAIRVEAQSYTVLQKEHTDGQ